ncbi:hypothetical protein EYF80_050620 [Liparis tanakae]|uniref:Uncharacterized protein n=1 Tax=Liparis tanakae TaxID=230148 RepID=A0A4Z2FE01_9TELE|nr:hypothetical protein EYF80_050620 [Liparis tanakae]
MGCRVVDAVHRLVSRLQDEFSLEFKILKTGGTGGVCKKIDDTQDTLKLDSHSLYRQHDGASRPSKTEQDAA